MSSAKNRRCFNKSEAEKPAHKTDNIKMSKLQFRKYLPHEVTGRGIRTFFFAAGFPFVFCKKKYHCFNCGKDFSKREIDA